MESILKKPKKVGGIYLNKLLITLVDGTSKINAFNLPLSHEKRDGKYIKRRVDSAIFDALKIQSKT